MDLALLSNVVMALAAAWAGWLTWRGGRESGFDDVVKVQQALVAAEKIGEPHGPLLSAIVFETLRRKHFRSRAPVPALLGIFWVASSFWILQLGESIPGRIYVPPYGIGSLAGPKIVILFLGMGLMFTGLLQLKSSADYLRSTHFRIARQLAAAENQAYESVAKTLPPLPTDSPSLWFEQLTHKSHAWLRKHPWTRLTFGFLLVIAVIASILYMMSIY